MAETQTTTNPTHDHHQGSPSNGTPGTSEGSRDVSLMVKEDTAAMVRKHTAKGWSTDVIIRAAMLLLDAKGVASPPTPKEMAANLAGAKS